MLPVLRCSRFWVLLLGLVGLGYGATTGQEKAVLHPKPVTPPTGAVRVRIPLTDEKTGFCHFSALLPRPKSSGASTPPSDSPQAEKGEPGHIPITVIYEARPGRSIVSVKKWRKWGFDPPPPGKKAILPELFIPAVQLLPVRQPSPDVWIRLTQIPVELVDLPGDAEAILGSDMLLSVSDLTRQAEQRWQPHLHLGDLCLDLTVPIGQVRYREMQTVRRAGKVTPGLEKYPAVAAVISPKGLPIFTYVALNGKSRYALPDGQIMPVRGVVASVLHCPGGIAMTLGTARGCGLDIRPDKVPGLGTSFKTTLAKAHVQELRLEVFLAPDYTARRDLLLKDLHVWVDLHDSDHLVWFGPQFWRQHFVDPVYVCGPDRTWKLYGRIAPHLLADPKTRPENLNK
ncbi:MAG: hypothetical protein WHU94_10735 [Thermogemmata sp.]